MGLVRWSAILLIAATTAVLAGCGDPDQADMQAAVDRTGLEVDWAELDSGESAEWLLRGDIHTPSGKRLRFFVWRDEEPGSPGDPQIVEAQAKDLEMSYVAVDGVTLASQEFLQRRDPRHDWTHRLEVAFCTELTGDICGP